MSNTENTGPVQPEPARWSVAPEQLPSLQVKAGESIDIFTVIQSDEQALALKADNGVMMGCGLAGLLLLPCGIFATVWTFTRMNTTEPNAHKVMGTIDGVLLVLGFVGLWILTTQVGRAYRFEGATRTAQQSHTRFSQKTWSADAISAIQIVTQPINSAGSERYQVQMVDRQGKPLLRLDDVVTSNTTSDGMVRLAIQVGRLFRIPVEVIGYPQKASEALKTVLTTLLPGVSG